MESRATRRVRNVKISSRQEGALLATVREASQPDGAAPLFCYGSHRKPRLPSLPGLPAPSLLLPALPRQPGGGLELSAAAPPFYRYPQRLVPLPDRDADGARGERQRRPPIRRTARVRSVGRRMAASAPSPLGQLMSSTNTSGAPGFRTRAASATSFSASPHSVSALKTLRHSRLRPPVGSRGRSASSRRTARPRRRRPNKRSSFASSSMPTTMPTVLGSSTGSSPADAELNTRRRRGRACRHRAGDESTRQWPRTPWRCRTRRGRRGAGRGGRNPRASARSSSGVGVTGSHARELRGPRRATRRGERRPESTRGARRGGGRGRHAPSRRRRRSRADARGSERRRLSRDRARASGGGRRRRRRRCR